VAQETAAEDAGATAARFRDGKLQILKWPPGASAGTAAVIARLRIKCRSSARSAQLRGLLEKK